MIFILTDVRVCDQKSLETAVLGSIYLQVRTLQPRRPTSTRLPQREPQMPCQVSIFSTSL